MPVEIKELVIRAAVESGRGLERVKRGDDPGAISEREAFVQECVRQVIRILEKKRER